MRYLDIYESIKTAIEEGRYKAHSRLPYVTELMAQFRAGRGTIQHALNLLTEEGLVKGVRSQGVFVRERRAGSSFSPQGRIRRAGILCPGHPVAMMRMPYFANICRGIENEWLRKGIKPFLLSCKDLTFREIIRDIRALELRGLCVVDVQDGKLRADLESIRLPIVYTDIFESQGKVPLVLGDNVRGGYLAARRLIELGHKRLLFFTHFASDTGKPEPMALLKWKGIREASMERSGVKIRKILRSLNSRDALETIKAVLAEHPDFTAILLPGLFWFQMVKSVLERYWPERVNFMDIVVFDGCREPLAFGGKRALICGWDGVEMGRISAGRLLDNSRNGSRISYIPMKLFEYPAQKTGISTE